MRNKILKYYGITILSMCCFTAYAVQVSGDQLMTLGKVDAPRFIVADKTWPAHPG